MMFVSPTGYTQAQTNFSWRSGLECTLLRRAGNHQNRDFGARL